MGGAARIVIWVATVVAVVLAALFVVRLATTPATLRPVTKIEFHQSAAEPGFDTSTVAVTDPTRLHEFGSLVHQYNVKLSSFDSDATAGCAGGTTTHATLHFTNDTVQKITLYDCGGGAQGHNFVAKATSLFSGWRAAA